MSKNTWKIILYITFSILAGAIIGYVHSGADGMANGMVAGCMAGICLVFFSWLLVEW